MKRKRNNKLLVLIIAPVTALVLLWIMGKKSEDAPALSVKVVKKSFSVLVGAVGELYAEKSTVVFSQIRGDRGAIVFIVSDSTKVTPIFGIISLIKNGLICLLQ